MTIASEIQRIQTNIANAYDAAEAKGATMPVTENSDSLATTIESITSGSSAKLQTKNALENGTLLPDEGYDGISRVNVNVATTGHVIDVVNKTGAVVHSDDKVWINSYSYNEGSNTLIAPVHNSYLHNKAIYLVSADGQSYIVKGTATTSLPKGHYRISDNTLISNTGLDTSGAKIIPNPSDGGSTFIVVNGSATSSNSASMHSYTGSTTFTNLFSRIVCNAPWLILNVYHSSSPYTYTIAEYDLNSRTLISETPIDAPSSYNWLEPNLYAGVKLDDTHLLFVQSYNTAHLFTYNSELNKWELTRTVTISGVPSSSYVFGFVTPDGKYMLMGTRLCYLGNVLSGGNITSTDFSSIIATISTTYYSCLACGYTFKLIVTKTIDSKTYNLVYNYNAETGTFDQVAIDRDNPDTNQFAGCDAYMDYQVFLRPYSGTTKYDAYLVNTLATTGNFLVSYSPSNITRDTQTGMATSLMAAGASGKALTGAITNPTENINIYSNGAYDVSSFGSANVLVPVPGVNCDVLAAGSYTGRMRKLNVYINNNNQLSYDINPALLPSGLSGSLAINQACWNQNNNCIFIAYNQANTILVEYFRSGFQTIRLNAGSSSVKPISVGCFGIVYDQLATYTFIQDDSGAIYYINIPTGNDPRYSAIYKTSTVLPVGRFWSGMPEIVHSSVPSGTTDALLYFKGAYDLADSAWSSTTIPGAGALHSIAYSPDANYYVACFDNGMYYTDSGLTVWTQLSETASDVYYCNDKFIALIDGSENTLESTDGVSWEELPAQLPTMYLHSAGYYGCSKWNQIIASVNGGMYYYFEDTWYYAALSTPSSLEGKEFVMG